MDGLCNSMETANGSDPTDICEFPNGADVDDGLCDQLEILIGSSASDPATPTATTLTETASAIRRNCWKAGVLTPCSLNDTDVDGDGWCGGMETANGWNDLDPCAPIGTDSDGDGRATWKSLRKRCPRPLLSCLDTDGDGWCDVYDVQWNVAHEVEGVLDVKGPKAMHLTSVGQPMGSVSFANTALASWSFSTLADVRWQKADSGRQCSDGTRRPVLAAPAGIRTSGSTGLHGY